MTSENQDKADEQRVALQQYGYVMGYLQYENSVYWTRVGFVIAAQAALVAFGAGQMSEAAKTHSVFPAIITIGSGLLGVILCLLGLRMTEGSVRWINHWIKILCALELKAFDDIQVFRDSDNIVQGGLRGAANHVLYVFMGAWGILLALFVGYLARC